MNVLGFYAEPDGVLDIVKFLAVNLEGICQVLAPQKAPRLIITDEIISPDVPVMRCGEGSIFYCKDEVTIVDLDTGEEERIANIFVLYRKGIHTLFDEMLTDVGNLLLALWQVVFHEVRHFVVWQCIEQTIHPEFLFLADVLSDIETRNVAVARVGYIRVHAYRFFPEALKQKEVDAIAVELLAMSALIVHVEQGDGSTFDFNPVRAVLTLSMAEYKRNPSVLDYL